LVNNVLALLVMRHTEFRNTAGRLTLTRALSHPMGEEQSPVGAAFSGRDGALRRPVIAAMTLPIPVPGWAGGIGFATPGLFCAKSSILRVF
jgi:hypothetical protein